MRKKINVTLATIAFACSISSANNAHASSASVSVSITFAVAPADLINADTSAPEDVRACNKIDGKIEHIWQSQTKRPTLQCANAKKMPLIVTSDTIEGLIVRP